MFEVNAFGAKPSQRVRTPDLASHRQARIEELARQANRYRGTYFLEGLTERKWIALTFDDGPSSDSAALLEALRRFRVKATFFWRGANVEEHPQIARSALQQGHTLANHTYSHPHCGGLSVQAFWRDEVERTQALFERCLGFRPSLFRPPYGEISDGQVELLQEQGMKVIAWSVDPRDWLCAKQLRGRRRIVDTVVRGAHPEAIVLLHDGGGPRAKTTAAVIELVPYLQTQGYRFVTVDELIGSPALLAQRVC